MSQEDHANFAKFVELNKGREGQTIVKLDGEEVPRTVYMGDGAYAMANRDLVSIVKEHPTGNNKSINITKDQLGHLQNLLSETAAPNNMRSIMDTLSEDDLAEGKKDYELYHKSFSDAFEEVQQFVAAHGFEMNKEDVYTQVETGGTYGRARPSVGQTHKFSIRLEQNGEETNKTIQFQVYGMETSYELNMYIG